MLSACSPLRYTFGGSGTMKASQGARRSVNGDVIVSYGPHWSSQAMKRMRVPSLNQPTITKAWSSVATRTG